MKKTISLEYCNIFRSTTRCVPFLPMFNMLDGVPVSQPSSTQSQSSCIISFFRIVCSLAFIHPASLFLRNSLPHPPLSSKGWVGLPNWMNFRKNSKRPSTHPHFRKIMLQFLYNGYGCTYASIYEGQKV